MRKVVLGLMCALLCVSAMARERSAASLQVFPENEISISYGAVTFPYIAAGFAGAFGAALVGAASGGSVTLEQISSTGAFSGQYYRMLRPVFGLGVETVFEQCSLLFSGGDANKTQFLSVMPSAKIYYFRRPKAAMYFRGSAGVMLGGDVFTAGESEAPQVSVSFAAHVSPLGLSFGSGALKGLVEVGIGMGPLACLGLQYSF